MKITLCIFTFILLLSCNQNNSQIDICNANQGRMIHGKNYIPSVFLGENKMIDYIAWFKAVIHGKNEFCRAVERPKNLREIIEENEETIDINR